jgi:hypothetical protein
MGGTAMIVLGLAELADYIAGFKVIGWSVFRIGESQKGQAG